MCINISMLNGLIYNCISRLRSKISISCVYIYIIPYMCVYVCWVLSISFYWYIFVEKAFQFVIKICKLISLHYQRSCFSLGSYNFRIPWNGTEATGGTENTDQFDCGSQSHFGFTGFN